ncbi:arsenate reductase (glutaredoxin) [Methylovorus sp. MP688]|uniref:arsenate reductase (glutaredoxin) n=1 Tax=Methylovorus sp. (strain MP688) TaxID=887061 RepID=UPI0001EC4885|nr:arsenate reductase (glutaredoxin) [Methylovorus sp. MP688]ADQ84973.1 arsenate reductase [Methylovorus sp. MP688]
MINVIIYHNPKCSKSRETLALIQNAGISPNVIEYLNTPPDSTTIEQWLKDSRMEARDLLRSNEEIYQELNLSDLSLSDEDLIAAMVSHPVLINRPIVVTRHGTRLCRPAERVLEILKP